jgi:hypothetical protein
MYDSASFFNDTIDLYNMNSEEAEHIRQPTILKQHRIDQICSLRTGLSDYEREHLFAYLVQGE